MNAIETAIMEAAKAAQEFHTAMTYGQYVSYSHESFLQNYIAMQLFETTEHCVYVDPSKRKIRDWVGKRGPLPADVRNRFDVVVWHKTKDSVKAVIEVKQAWVTRIVLEDVHKVSKFLKTGSGTGAFGYVLYYTDKRKNEQLPEKDDKTIRGRFQRLHNRMQDCVRSTRKVGLIAEYVDAEGVHDPWGIGLFRC